MEERGRRFQGGLGNVSNCPSNHHLLVLLPSDVEAIARLIVSFLELHRLESPMELSQSSDSEAEGPGDQR